MVDQTRILLVEDNSADAHLIEMFFKAADPTLRIDRVADGDEAIRYLCGEQPVLGATRPDFILLDLSLPGKGGLDVLQTVRRHEHLKHIPIVILSGSTDASDVLKSYELEANGFVTKPTGIQEFAKSIRRIIDVELPRLRRAIRHGDGKDANLQ